MNNQRRLYRSTEERMFAGVCGGIAEYLEVDPTMVRLVFVALTLLGGPGPIIYFVLMLIVPEDPGLVVWKRKRDAGFEDDDVMAPSSIPVPTDDPAPPDDVAPPDEFDA